MPYGGFPSRGWLAFADPCIPQDLLDSMNQTYVDYEKTYVEKIAELMKTYGKPLFGVSVLSDASDSMVYAASNNPYKAVFYETPERAVSAFSKMVEYQQFLNRIRTEEE